MKSNSSLPGKQTLADTAASKSEPFHKLTGSEAKELYKLGVFDANAYVLMIVKSHGAAGWKWTFKVKDFCKDWEIPQRTFYRAISKLKTLNLLHWEVKDAISVWFGADIAQTATNGTNNQVSVLKEQSLVSKQNSVKIVESSSGRDAQTAIGINSLPQVAVPVPQVAVPVPQVAVSVPQVAVSVPQVAQQTAETLVSSSVVEASDSSQIIYQRNTHIAALADATPAPHPDVCVPSEKEEEVQPTISEAVAVKADQDLGFVGELIKDLAQRKDLIQDTSAAAEKSKKSKNTQSTRIKWECPGTADEKLEFLKWKGALLANLGKTSIAEAESAALGWANKHPEEATLAYDGWKREINQKQTPAPKPSHSVLFAAPSFETMPLSQHEALVRAYVAEGEEAFKAREVWHSDWLKFAKQYLNRVFKKVVQETP